MRKSVMFLAIAGLALSPIAEAGANQGALVVVKSGFTAYHAHGASSAIKAWLKGSPLEGSKAASTQVNNLNTVEDYYGQYTGYEITHVHDVTKNSVMVLAVADFQDGPLFCKFFIYKTHDKGWVLDYFKFNTFPDQVWPDDMVYGDP